MFAIFNNYVFITIGYGSATLYAEAETRLFLANDSNSSDYLYMEEVRVFINKNNSKLYFKLEEATTVIEMTTNKSEAAFFTLKTTAEHHKLGQFQLVYAAGNVSESRTPMQDELIMKLDYERPITQYGPYQLQPYSEECRNVLYFEVQGKSTTALPDFQS